MPTRKWTAVMPTRKWTAAQRAKFTSTMREKKRAKRHFKAQVKRFNKALQRNPETLRGAGFRLWKRIPKYVYVLQNGQLVRARLHRVHAYTLEA